MPWGTVRLDDDRPAHRADDHCRLVAPVGVGLAVEPALGLAVGTRPGELVGFRCLRQRAQAALFFELRFKSAEAIAQGCLLGGSGAVAAGFAGAGTTLTRLSSALTGFALLPGGGRLP